jgi:hypothetical protein
VLLLAQLYNNISVNENHHCACVWKMLAQPELNITENLTQEQWRELRGCAPHWRFLPCHSLLHTPLKSPCAEQPRRQDFYGHGYV